MKTRIPGPGTPLQYVARVVRLATCVSFGATIVACSESGTTSPPAAAEAVGVRFPATKQSATVGILFTHDATQGGNAFTDPRGRGLTYAVVFAPSSNGLSANAGRITGIPLVPGTTRVVVTASDAAGSSARDSFDIEVNDRNFDVPVLPAVHYAYSDASRPLPAHFLAPGPGGPAVATDNTPVTNPTTDAGATLGRVLFYDRRLSQNGAVSCASCHRQELGFADTARLSVGFAGTLTGRHSMALINARFYQPARFFWDERAATLESQVLQPIQDAAEMGMTLPQVVDRLNATAFYPELFRAAFGSGEVTSERIARALAQFVRALVSGSSRFDQALATGGPPNFAVLTPQEQQGLEVFNGPGRCALCHATNAHVAPNAANSGLDAQTVDAGAGQGRFKAPSLRNVAVRGRFMHDGRFRTLEEVVAFYDNGVQNNPGLDPRLRTPNGQPIRLNLGPQQRAALVAFLRTLTDESFLTDVRFSDPFPSR